MTLQVHVQVTQFWQMFTPSFFDFSSFFFSRSFHLGITIIKSSGSRIEFESLYFSPIVVFHPSCHSNTNHFSLLAWADFQLCCACIFYIYHQICRACPVWKPETLNYVETYFNYTVLRRKKELYYMVLEPLSQKQLIPFCFKAIFSSPPS